MDKEKIRREKNAELYDKQKELLATLLSHGAITRAQHDHSLKCLTEKMKDSGKE
jgi:hypothetical protein